MGIKYDSSIASLCKNLSKTKTTSLKIYLLLHLLSNHCDTFSTHSKLNSKYPIRGFLFS